MNLKGKKIRVTESSRRPHASVWRVAAWSFMQSSPVSGGGTFVLLCVGEGGEVNQFSVGEARIEVIADETNQQATPLIDWKVARPPADTEAAEAIAAPTEVPDLSTALVTVAEERDRMRDAYEKLAAGADRQLKDLRARIAMLTDTPSIMPSLTEGTEERDGRLFYSGTLTPAEVPTSDGAAYLEWSRRLVAERNAIRKRCLEMQVRLDQISNSFGNYTRRRDG